MYKYYNPNPQGHRVGDCTVRAISKVLNKEWEAVYIDLSIQGLKMADMPSSNSVWGRYLQDNGFERHFAEIGTTVEEFTHSHTKGAYVLAISGHVVAVVDGDYYDAWDSGNERPVYYWEVR